MKKLHEVYNLLTINVWKFHYFLKMQDFDFPQIIYHFLLFGYLVTHHWTSCVESKFNWIEWHAIIIVFGFSCQKSIVSWEWGMWSNIFFIKTGSPQPNVVRYSKGFWNAEKLLSFFPLMHLLDVFVRVKLSKTFHLVSYNLFNRGNNQKN